MSFPPSVHPTDRGSSHSPKIVKEDWVVIRVCALCNQPYPCAPAVAILEAARNNKSASDAPTP